MKAQIGERLLFHGEKVGSTDHTAEVLQVRGDDGAPPYLVRFDDGHERLMFPGRTARSCTTTTGRPAPTRPNSSVAGPRLRRRDAQSALAGVTKPYAAVGTSCRR